MLSPETVIKLASVLSLDDEAFIVGGQALNLWAERYAPGNPALIAYGPFTSKDLDYFGHREAATKLATALGGVVRFPAQGDHTSSVAIVEAQIGDDWVAIDFISDVIGVDPTDLGRRAVELQVPISVNGEAGAGMMNIPVMHPLHCFQSRVGNVATLGRTSTLALQQLQASPHVLTGYVDEMLDAGDFREAAKTLDGLFHFLARDIAGRKAADFLQLDLIEVFKRYQADHRFDARYRHFNLASMTIRLELQKTARLLRRRPSATPAR